VTWHLLRWLEEAENDLQELWGRDRHKRTVQPGKKSVHKKVEGLPTVPTLFSWQSLVWSKPLRVYNREWSFNVSAHDVLTLLSVACHKSGNMAMPLVVRTKAQRNNRDLRYLFMGRSCARCWNICLCAQYGDNTLSWRSVHKQIYMFKESQTKMTDAQCIGRPSTSASDENLEAAWCLRTVWEHPHAVTHFCSI